MNAQQAIEWIHGARYKGEKVGLRNTRALLEALGNPDRGLNMVHVAGTNGKGSVCALTERALRACGLKTGLYTSPFLSRYNERFRLNGAPIEDERLAQVADKVYDAARMLEAAYGIHPTSFELGTALAMEFFKQEKVDVAVIETGLGGRLDPTNVIAPKVCGIATIAMDHMKVLGDSLEAIAGEKAGIIKRGVPVALYPQPDSVRAVFERAAQAADAPLLDLSGAKVEILREDALGSRFRVEMPGYVPREVSISLPGRHQMNNAVLALAMLRLLGKEMALDEERLIQGLALARWPGRLEWLGNVLLDGGHNEEGAHALYAYASEHLKGKKMVLLTAMMKDKAVREALSWLSRISTQAVTTTLDMPRAMEAGALAEIYRENGVEALAVEDAHQALLQAQKLAGPDGVVLVSGSLYLVGLLRPDLPGAYEAL